MLQTEAPTGAHYQAIFKTATGRDYCRETLSARKLVDAQIEADYLLVKYGSPAGAVSYRLECW